MDAAINQQLMNGLQMRREYRYSLHRLLWYQ